MWAIWVLYVQGECRVRWVRGVLWLKSVRWFSGVDDDDGLRSPLCFSSSSFCVLYPLKRALSFSFPKRSLPFHFPRAPCVFYFPRDQSSFCIGQEILINLLNLFDFWRKKTWWEKDLQRSSLNFYYYFLFYLLFVIYFFFQIINDKNKTFF